MKYIILHLILILGSTSINASSHSKDPKHLKKDCEEMLAGIAWLLEDADKEWAFLKDNPEGSPDFIEHTLKINGLPASRQTMPKCTKYFVKKIIINKFNSYISR